jgi:hypothetical protein
MDGLQQEHGKTMWSELAPINAPRRMDDNWLGNSYLLGFSSLINHGG